MKPQPFIFIGRSGSGKGTQAGLLIDALKKVDPSHGSLYVQTGEEFRNFIKGDTYTEKIAKKIYDAGELEPEFVATYLWVKILNEHFTGDQHIIFDGTPRRLHEAGVLDSVFGFYGLDNPWVIHVDIGPEESLKRLLLRKRADDSEEDIQERLSWYETEVVPVVEYYRDNQDCQFSVDINGERSIEEIHADIVKRLGLS